MPAILEIHNASVYRGDTRVFSDLSLTIPSGCHTAVLGPNGAGKSTLLKLLTRELYPVAKAGSSVRLFGRDRWDLWELRTRLGIISHDLQQQYADGAQGLNVILSGLYSSIDVFSHQRFTADHRARADRIMERLGVAALQDRPFVTMSTGQQRRFLLGRALINEPEVLVLDEPTSGLDLPACFQYLEIVRGLMQAGTTVILVTHHLHEIPPEVSRVVLLKNGRITADGKKPEVFTADNLSRLFDIPIELVQINGFYQALPARSAPLDPGRTP